MYALKSIGFSENYGNEFYYWDCYSGSCLS